MEHAVHRKRSSSSVGRNVRRQAFAASPPSCREVIVAHCHLPHVIYQTCGDLKGAPGRRNPAAVCDRLPLRLIACNSPQWFLLTASVPTDSWRPIQTLARRNSRSRVPYSRTRGRSERRLHT